ncbi:hypothetical protein E4U17_007571 [Claviceps sp. LM77 group G4]|nr:hypothetical protein E4U17_007571 [Claviceps sp. LM77 group G4]KAG6070569.1 hypothetical protein E4U16_006777 [Claviceps sp. LM84 group G4]KAG6076562.1 hypothetical protein E4U33_001754 [Claviceps sp. LM78 group G4]
MLPRPRIPALTSPLRLPLRLLPRPSPLLLRTLHKNTTKDHDDHSPAPQPEDAEKMDSSFQKGANTPEAARERASRESEDGAIDALALRGADHELSKPQGDEGSKGYGAGKEIRKGGRSGRGETTKKGGGA